MKDMMPAMLSKHTTRAFLGFALCTLLFTPGCSRQTNLTLSEMATLRQRLGDQYRATNVGVVVQNGEVLGVSLVNSPFNSLNGDEKARKAYEVAAFAKQHFTGIDRIKRVSVAFVVRRNYLFVFNYSDARDTFIFDKDRLPSRAELKTLNEILAAGNAAFLAGRYEEAVEQFDAGLAISPEEPTLLVNRATALVRRGVERYNVAIKSANAYGKTEGRAAAERDLRDAADAAIRAVAVINTTQRPASPGNRALYDTNKLGALTVRAEALRLLAARFDKAQSTLALTAVHEYIGAEPDSAKRLKARRDVGQMLLDLGDGKRAAAEYRQVLSVAPDDVDSTLGVGLALLQAGDDTRYSEAAAHLRSFIERSSSVHPRRQAAIDALAVVER